ncbi:Tachykinin-like peptides receptor 86C [Gryllus bimaculatus]|nr:Tachykinin-like peptides receptor 86C [Gryllus bimaculatus]
MRKRPYGSMGKRTVSVAVSVLTLTFISVDRWYAICFPLKFKSTTNRAKTAIIIIWLLALAFDVPELVVLEAVRKDDWSLDTILLTQCVAHWRDDAEMTFTIVKSMLLYTCPLVFMSVAYCQIVRVLWKSDNIPGHTETAKYSVSCNNGFSTYTLNLPQNDTTVVISLLSHWLCYANSAVNPIIYNFMSGE